MSRFDLTFSGRVIEEFEVDQVKRSMGILLDLAEPAQLDNLFLGRSFVLGQNLARKSAAEMYSKLTAVGAQVELVPRGKTPADAQILHSAFALAHTASDKPEKPKPDHSVPPQHRGHPVKEQAQEEASRLAGIRASMHELQRELDSMKQAARRESSKLQHRVDYFHRIADKELSLIARARDEASDESVARVEELEQTVMDCHERAERAIAKLKENERKTSQRAKQETDRLHGLILETEDEEQSALEQLDQARAEIRERTEARVQELLAQIEELETTAESELATIEQQATGHLNSWKLERNALENEQEEIHSQTQEQLEWLLEQQNIVAAESEEEIARIEQQRSDTREARKDALVALQERQDVIETTLQRNLARAQRADEKAREKSKLALQLLHARKLELQRQATEAMHETGEKVLQAGIKKQPYGKLS